MHDMRTDNEDMYVTGNAVNSDNGGLDLSQNDKRAFLLDTLREAFSCIRYYHDTAYKVSTWGSAAFVAFTVFVVGNKPMQGLWQKVLIACVLAVFTLALVLIILRCRKLLLTYWRVVSRIDHAFLAFARDEYIAGQALFPHSWKRLGQKGWRERYTQLLIIPPILTAILALLAVFVG